MDLYGEGSLLANLEILLKKRLFRESGCFGSKYNIALSLFPDWDNQLTLIGNLMKTQPFVKESKYKFYGCIINEEGLGFCNLEQDLFIIRGKHSFLFHIMLSAT